MGERERERGEGEGEKCRVQDGEIAMLCLPARGAREEKERKRKERGCEDRWLFLLSWSEPATYFSPSHGHQRSDLDFTHKSSPCDLVVGGDSLSLSRSLNLNSGMLGAQV